MRSTAQHRSAPAAGPILAELWLVDLRRAAPALRALERMCPRLSPGDRRRARQLRDPAERADRLAVYTALRLLLERIAGPGVRGREFIRTGGGKPRLRGGAAHFSLAHTGRLALIGVTRGRAIGVDLENARSVRVSPRRRLEILAAARGLAGAQLPGGDSDSAFLQAWSRLEAAAKTRGDGISRTLARLGLREAGGRELTPAAIEAAARRLAREARLTVRDVALPAGLHGTIAIAGHGAVPRLRRLPAGGRALRRLAGPPGHHG